MRITIDLSPELVVLLASVWAGRRSLIHVRSRKRP